MLVDVPNEVWTEILKRVVGVNDWGQLQQVSRAFYAIAQDHCWTQAKELKIHIDLSGVGLDVNGDGWMGLSDENVLLLTKELAEKADKIQAVSLKVYRNVLPEDTGGLVLQRLASAALEIKQLDICLGIYGVVSAAQPLADFVSSIGGTLESLNCDMVTGPIIAPELHQAFRSCLAIQTMEIGVWDQTMFESVLYGKTQLQSVGILEYEGPPLPASALLNTGAHLISCHFAEGNFPLFRAYTRAVQERNLIADHPLRTLKALSFDDHPGRPTPPFLLFPDLEYLVLYTNRLDWGILNALFDQFLGQYWHAPGNRRLLEIRVRGFPPSPMPFKRLIEGNAVTRALVHP